MPSTDNSPMRINLVTPFAEKDDAKKLGAKWNSTRKCWYIVDVADLTPFMRWIPDLVAAASDESMAGECGGPSCHQKGCRHHHQDKCVAGEGSEYSPALRLQCETVGRLRAHSGPLLTSINAQIASTQTLNWTYQTIKSDLPLVVLVWIKERPYGEPFFSGKGWS